MPTKFERLMGDAPVLPPLMGVGISGLDSRSRGPPKLRNDAFRDNKEESAGKKAALASLFRPPTHLQFNGNFEQVGCMKAIGLWARPYV